MDKRKILFDFFEVVGVFGDKTKGAERMALCKKVRHSALVPPLPFFSFFFLFFFYPPDARKARAKKGRRNLSWLRIIPGGGRQIRPEPPQCRNPHSTKGKKGLENANLQQVSAIIPKGS